jgi:hypothetical protein
MALTKRKTRITARRVAEILGCSPKTVYNGAQGQTVSLAYRTVLVKFVTFLKKY